LLLDCQPSIAADQDQLATRVRFTEVRFEDRPVLGSQVAEYLGDATVLARLGQFKCTFNCGCHPHRRYHELAAETNAAALKACQPRIG
jgi:hypothetical protein